jgi:predicted CXXCH cytochrome family protein
MPHVSDLPLLLTEPAGDLCSTCHDLEDEDLVSAHLGADLTNLVCGSCHTPHGSGHPSLLAANLHEPVLDGCDLCHQDTFDQFTESDSTEVCLMCHDDISDFAAAATVPHDAMELGGCTDCHNPHASSQPRLVKAPGAGPCAECHEDQVPGEGEVAHRLIDSHGCASCHSPRGGEEETLLRTTGSDLCLSCHNVERVDPAGRLVADPESVPGRLGDPETFSRRIPQIHINAVGRGHPVEFHLALGSPVAEIVERAEVTWEGEMTCMTCHDPHKGRTRTILRWDAVTAAGTCVACHPK